MSSSSPCAACKLQRRKCGQKCIFAPYFPPDNPQKFANIHKVFGASNVSKILSELSAHQRDDAVNSLAYEAEYRLREPVYGCVGLISLLKQRLNQLQVDLENAKKELATYIGPSALLPLVHHAGYINALQPPSLYTNPFGMVPNYEHQANDPVLFDNGYQGSEGDESSCTGLNLFSASPFPPSLALGCNTDNTYQSKQQQPQGFVLHSHPHGSGCNLDDGAGALSC